MIRAQKSPDPGHQRGTRRSIQPFVTRLPQPLRGFLPTRQYQAGRSRWPGQGRHMATRRKNLPRAASFSAHHAGIVVRESSGWTAHVGRDLAEDKALKRRMRDQTISSPGNPPSSPSVQARTGFRFRDLTCCIIYLIRFFNFWRENNGGTISRMRVSPERSPEASPESNQRPNPLKKGRSP